MAGGGGESKSLEFTPTWIMASVCSTMVIISMLMERFLHGLGKRLMLLGFISLLLTVLQGPMGKLCVGRSHLLPSKPTPTAYPPCRTDHLGHAVLGGTSWLLGLATGGSSDSYCLQKGKAPLISSQTIHQIHILIFVLAVTHFLLSAITVLLGIAQTRNSRHWETKIQIYDYSAPQMINHIQEFKFIQGHLFAGNQESTSSTISSSSDINDEAIKLRTLEGILIDANTEPAKLSYTFIKHITRNFSQEIGRGGFGVVYLGNLGTMKVAVKKLFISQGFDDMFFTDEINCLMKAKHNNIVRFLGYCAETDCEFRFFNGKPVLTHLPQRLLCFEYVPNGNLQRYLKDKSHKDKWQIRYQMIRGICHGLNYLHQQRVNHLDLKPDNILLDAHMEPKITDFGLSRCFSEGITRVYTKTVCGTLGCIAPEIIRSGEITFKADIYGLGIIIIKLLTGNNNYDLEDWHKSLDVDGPQVEHCIEIAQTCVLMDHRKRPAIGEIMQKLNEIERL